ncbi:MAG TPA: CRTAC1 family protein [Methylomirabilota bacterium]|nr:CRTAC1 family protein [Methylomirabilota bacterium]
MRALVAGLAGVLLCAGCGEKRNANTAASEPPAPRSTITASSASPAANIFEDVTENVGLKFTHRAGTNYFMADQIGSGVALFDANNDGRLDVYFTQNGGVGAAAANRFFEQRPNGSFKDVTEGSGLGVTGKGMGAIAGDINNDGLPDLVLTEYGATRLFQNLGMSRFREITAECGVDNVRWAVPASFIDFDRDGRLDLVVANYVDYDPSQICHDHQGRQEFCAPEAFPATTTRLWRNITEGNGAPPRFEDWTVRSGLIAKPGVALGLVCADFTGDKWPDIFCSDDGRPNRLFVNQRNGTFAEEAIARGLAHNAMGRTAANMGVAYADMSGDALPDLFVTHLSEEFHSFYRQDQPGLFSDTIAQTGLQQQGWRGTGFGAVAADFNSDGWNDVAFVNGLVRRATPGQTPVAQGTDPWWARYAQRPQIFLNQNGRFQDVSPANPNFSGEAVVGRSLAVGDIDNDGHPDLLVGAVGGPAKLYRNIAPQRGHWLKLRLLEPRYGNRDAIGAEVSLSARDRRWWALLQPATSYLASNDPALHFGLGTAALAEEAQVVWADGKVEIFRIRNVDREVVLRRGEGKAL